MTHFDLKKQIYIKSDSFDFVFAEILSQLKENDELHSVTFFSKNLASIECNYEIYDKELCWTKALHEWWESTYYVSRKHLMMMIRWCSFMIQILSARRFDDESHSRLVSSSDDLLRIELDFQAMTSNRDHYFDHYFDHHLKFERNQQTRKRNDWVDDVEAVWRRWNQITMLENDDFDWWRSLWIDESIISNRWDDCLDWMRAR